MIPSETDIICLHDGKQKVGKTKSYLGSGFYKVYLLESKEIIEINCKDILEVDR